MRKPGRTKWVFVGSGVALIGGWLLWVASAIAPERSGAPEKVDLRDPTQQVDSIELRLTACESRLAGKVLDSAGVGLPNARVRVRGASGTETGATGAYTLCVPPGSNQVIAEADGHGSVLLTVLVSGLTERDIVMVPGGFVRGRVVLDDGDQPVRGASVSVFPATPGPTQTAPASGVTDDAGRFNIPVGTGQVLVTAKADGRSTVMPVGVTVVFGLQPPELTLRIRYPSSRVIGVVVSDGKPVPGVRVMSTSRQDATQVESVTDDEGRFVLDSVPPGETVFSVLQWEVVTPRSVDVKAAEEQVELHVSRLGALRGLVTRKGVPLAGAHVSATSDLDTASAVSDLAGQYEVLGLSAGTYDVLGLSEEAGALAQAKVTVAAHEDRVLDLELAHGASISGIVVSERRPAPGVIVIFRNSKSGDVCNSVTDRAGQFVCNKMTGGGTYLAEVFAPTGERLPTRTEFPAFDLADDGVLKNVVLKVKVEQLTLRGTVVDRQGQGVADARVRVTAEDVSAARRGFPGATTTADPQGNFSLALAGPGPWLVQARAPDGATGRLTDVAAGPQRVRVVVDSMADIAGTLVDYERPPIVWAVDATRKRTLGEVDGATFRLRVAPGKYLVTAMSSSEGDAAQVDVSPGVVTKVELTAKGSCRLHGKVIEHGTGVPVPGLACHASMRKGGWTGVASWSLEAAPRTDAQGAFVVDPAPAGDVLVECWGNPAAVSRAAAMVEATRGERVGVSMEVVRRKGSGPAGDVGVTFGFGESGPVVEWVAPQSPAAHAGLSVGEVVVAIDGIPVGSLDSTGVEMLVINHTPGSTVALTTRSGSQLVTRVLPVRAW